MNLTIGMACHDDFDGVWSTIQALRLYNHLNDLELIVVDNNPGSRHGKMVHDLLGTWIVGGTYEITKQPHAPIRAVKYIPFVEYKGTSGPRDAIFRHATSDVVMCIDSHVMLPPGSLETLGKFYAKNPACMDLLSGPMLYDDLVQFSTHFADVWGDDQMWGTWDTDPRGHGSEPFEIGAMGLGLFACRRDAWLGFNPDFRGFGGEEWYIHTKFRQAGRKCLCLPGLRWLHRFGRPNGATYPLTLWHKARNYVIGHRELGLDLAPIHKSFVESGKLSEADWKLILSGAIEPPQQPCGAPCGQEISLEAWYEKAKGTPSDINEHVPTLRELAAKCDHVTEFGMRRGVSTVALLAGQPKRLVSYDMNVDAAAGGLKNLQGKCQFEFRQGDSRNVAIEETDLLFIDTVHTAPHVTAELANSASKVRKYLVFHDTEAPWGENGEDGGPGVMPAVRQFLWTNKEWVVKKHYRNNHGLTVLSRLPEDKKELPSMLRQIWNFAKSQTRHKLNGGKFLPLPMAQERQKSCAICEERNGENCSMCGCPLIQVPDDHPVKPGEPGKTFYPSEFCPKGEWGPMPEAGVDMTEEQVRSMLEEARK